MGSQSKAVEMARAGQSAWANNQRDGYEDQWAEDALWVNADGEEMYRGPEAITAYHWAVRDAFSDVDFDVTLAFGDDTHCVTVGRLRATHTGDLPTPAGPLPATGKTIDVPLCQVITVRGDKVESVTWYNQVMYTLIQLGLMPAPAPA